jgi:hypothetical protein
MSGTCITLRGGANMQTSSCYLKGRDHLQDFGVDGNAVLTYEISGSHGGEYEEDSCLGYSAV